MTVPLLAALLVPCGPPHAWAEMRLESAPLPAPFSASITGAALPHGWEAVSLGQRKKPTQYRLVDDNGTRVLHAEAKDAASGLAQYTVFDIRSAPIVEWSWKTRGPIEGADNRIAAKEDSPARLVFAFDGDKSRLSPFQRAIFYLTRKLAGRELPYALLEYVWSNDAPVGAVMQHPYTSRVQMIVAASGAAGVGTWQSLRRNIHDDFRRAFGEEPGNLIGVGVLTDTDNTGGYAETWYGDIRLRPR
jgi:hypothetical protein